jgi:myo-inositol-hexaphosphate 3-phosphohydrolase
LLDKEGNVLATEALANIRRITFSTSGPVTDVENVDSQSILVYPNPTQDALMVQGIEAQALRVYDLQGRLLVQEEGTQVNVNHLAEGTYLLQIGTQVVRFIKN